MSHKDDDPFAMPPSDDRTIIRPVPGGKRADLQGAPAAPQPSHFSDSPVLKLGNLNPLEKAASGLLALLSKLNTSHSQTDPQGLKTRMVKEIEQFKLNAQVEGIDHETVSGAQYVLCTALDEAVSQTPWGNDSNWHDESLLVFFYHETDGGQRFFHLLKALAEQPQKNRYLLELMYLCLALGFEGQYRLMEGGKNKLFNIKDWLYQILLKERGAAEPELSPHWQGVTDRRSPLLQMMPAWVYGAVAVGILTLLFSVLAFKLNIDSDPVFRQIAAISPPTASIPEPEPEHIVYVPSKPKLTLAILLADEIAKQQVAVQELSQRSTVTIQGDNLFESGSASIHSSLTPLLQKIADSLNQLPGQVLITGHTDNVPIRSLRYPSNWHLSEARAKAVADIIKATLSEQARIKLEGKADLKPIAPNTNKDGRAKNRRVEIALLR